MNNACNGYLNLGTERGIGTGKSNTETLVYYMGNDPYVSDPLNSPYDETTSPDYAAKLCADYELTVGEQVYDKWFLPSADELYLMLNNLRKNGIGSFDGESRYWSSSEDPGYSTYTKSVDFSESSGGIGSSMRLCGLRVRPVRAF